MGIRPLVIAHRGASEDYPENTPRAFREALKYKIYGIETDIQFSKDGVAVLFHDEYISSNEKKYRITDMAFDEIENIARADSKIEGYEDNKIQTLSEALNEFGGRTHLFFEFKVYQKESILTQRVSAIITACLNEGLESYISLLSFDEKIIRDSSSLFPGIRHILNIKAREKKNGFTKEYLKEISGICMDIKDASKELALEVKNSGREIFFYSINNSAELDAALSYEADYIMTDRPGWLLGILK